MNKLAPPHRWYTPWRATAVPQDDPADFGTAFGLELSLAPPPAGESRAVTGAHPRRGGWVERWAARRRPAA